jgi:multidrug efflux pump subunit AcrA (membrane-fusion protein)
VKVDGLDFPTASTPPSDVTPKPVDGTPEAPANEKADGQGASAEHKPAADPGTVTSPPPVAGAHEWEGTLKLVPGAVAGGGGGGVEVKHTLNARVNSVVVKPGKDVRKGQVLLVYDDAEAQRRLATARVQYDSIKEVAATQDTDRARKFLQEAKVDLDRAQAGVANLKLLAPSDGVVTQVAAEAGKRVGKGTVAVVMGGGEGGEAAPAQWKVVFQVPDDKAARFKEGATVSVALGAASASGFVETAEKAGGSTVVTAVLAKELGGAKDGASVKVK